jgi:cytochrome b561
MDNRRMPLRNGEDGYGRVTQALHWLTVGLLAAQISVGYLVDDDAADARTDELDERADAADDELDQRQDALGEGQEAREEALERQEDALDARADAEADALDDDVAGGLFDDGDWSLAELHVVLGVSIMALAAVRVVWRWATPLPPWAEALSPVERRVAGLTEKVLLTLLFVVPGSGLLLLVEDDLLPLHVAGHLALYTALTVHVGLVLRHTVVRRDRLLQRMW